MNIAKQLLGNSLVNTIKEKVSPRRKYVGWSSYKNKIDFLNEFYHEQAHLREKASA